MNSGSEGKARVGLGTGVSKARTCRSRTGVQWALYLEVPAVCREVHLNDEAGDIFAVADAVQTCALSEVIEVNCVFRRTNG